MAKWLLGSWMLVMACAGIDPANAQTVEYIHTDALGTPVAITDVNRNVIERSEYEPYGAVLNRPISDGPGYTGHVMDAATGLAYMQQRYYDPGIGRFLSVDPIAANANTGGGFNRYAYVLNNPYKFTDPDGRCEKATGSHICGGGGVAGAMLATSARSPLDTGRNQQTSGATRTGSATGNAFSPVPVANLAGAGNAGLSSVEPIAQGAVAATAAGEVTSEAASLLKNAAKFGKGASFVGGALAANELATGGTNLDRGHGALNLAIPVVGAFACAGSGVCGAAVVFYGIVDSAVQFKEYKDPMTGQHYSGWSALYKDATD